MGQTDARTVDWRLYFNYFFFFAAIAEGGGGEGGWGVTFCYFCFFPPLSFKKYIFVAFIFCSRFINLTMLEYCI